MCHLKDMTGQIGIGIGVDSHSFFRIQIPRERRCILPGSIVVVEQRRSSEANVLVGVDAHQNGSGGSVDLVSCVAQSQCVEERRLRDGGEEQNVGGTNVIFFLEGDEGRSILSGVEIINEEVIQLE
jgi:hypothetical protein